MSAKRKSKKKKISPILAVLLAILLFGYYYITEKQDRASWNTDGSFIMQAIDVGQGDSILLGCDGEYMLVDCGEEEEADAVLRAIDGLKLKYMLATHPHTDHMGGMHKIIRACPPETFLMPDKEHTTDQFRFMLDAIEETQTNAEYIYAGDTYTLGSAKITAVWPEEGYTGSNLNNWSVVLLVEYQGVSILLTGDAEKGVEDDYIEYIPGRIDILKMPHHGSNTSSSETLMSHIRPEYTVISVGTGNDYNHPHAEPMETLQKYCTKIYRTDTSGSVTFTIKEGEITVATER